MKRFHVHVGVEDLERSIRFYSGLFGAAPSVLRADYAKWMIEEPRLNFAISQRGGRIGVNHLGLQVDSDDELAALRGQFAAADATTLVDEPGSACCYAQSDKHWVTDPQGVAWEGYHTLSEFRFFSGDEAGAATAPACGTPDAKAACCAPTSVDTGTAARGRCCA